MFVELSYIIANVLLIKYRKFNELTMSMSEVLFIKKLLQKEYDEKKMDAIIVDKIDTYYFKICYDVISFNDKNNITLWKIENNVNFNYPKYLLHPKSEFLYDCILKYRDLL